MRILSQISFQLTEPPRWSEQSSIHGTSKRQNVSIRRKGSSWDKYKYEDVKTCSLPKNSKMQTGNTFQRHKDSRMKAGNCSSLLKASRMEVEIFLHCLKTPMRRRDFHYPYNERRSSSWGDFDSINERASHLRPTQTFMESNRLEYSK